MKAWLSSFPPQRWEAVGIALLLIGGLWEFTVLRQAAGEVAKSNQQAVHQQLKYIFEAVASDNRKKYFKEYEDQFDELTNSQTIEKSMDWFGNERASLIRYVFIFLGGVMTFVGKWLAGAKR